MLFTAVWEREGKMAGTPKEEIKRIADQFAFTGELVSCGPCGSGHINETYMLRYRIGEMGSIKVILQKINREIFQKPEELMENIAGVTGHLKKKVLQKGGDPEREVLNLIPTKDGKAFLTDENGECWFAALAVPHPRSPGKQTSSIRRLSSDDRLVLECQADTHAFRLTLNGNQLIRENL